MLRWGDLGLVWHLPLHLPLHHLPLLALHLALVIGLGSGMGLGLGSGVGVGVGVGVGLGLGLGSGFEGRLRLTGVREQRAALPLMRRQHGEPCSG